MTRVKPKLEYHPLSGTGGEDEQRSLCVIDAWRVSVCVCVWGLDGGGTLAR